MNTKISEKIIKRDLAPLFGSYPFIVAAYQFGSSAKGKEGPLSDVDIAILVDEARAPDKLGLLRIELLLSHEIERILKVPEVDLITLNRQRPTFQHTVLRTGRLIYEADPQYRVGFTRKVIEEYLDFEPTLRLIERFHARGRLRRAGIR